MGRGAAESRRVCMVPCRRQERAEQLLARYDSPKRRKIELMLAAMAAPFETLLTGGLGAPKTFPDESRELLAKELGRPRPAGRTWMLQTSSRCSGSPAVAEGRSGRASTLLDVIAPFVRSVRRSFVDSGWLTFDGLVGKARTLLREHPTIREQLKREYRALLVDEFQDTDPVQYEIVLYLAERQGRHSASWREIDPEAGKLFIVGDPKQSIYAFRRADIEAFDHVVVDRMERDGALRCELATNFRSHAQVLEVVNGVFNTLLIAEPLDSASECAAGRAAESIQPDATVRR